MVEPETESLFLQLTGESDDNAAFWRPVCTAAEQLLERQLSGCDAAEKTAFAPQIALTKAALAAYFYRQAMLAASPEKFTAGDLQVDGSRQAEAALAFYRSCAETLAPLTGDAEPFRSVET